MPDPIFDVKAYQSSYDEIADLKGGQNVMELMGITRDQLDQLGVVPLPSAAWAGMALLGGLGVSRYFRRRYVIA